LKNPYYDNPRHVVDVHTHIFAEEYREKLIDETLVMPGSDELMLIRGSDGKISSLLESAEENNISKFFILPVVKNPGMIEQINDFCYQESRIDPRAVFCGTVSPRHPRLKEILFDLKSRDAKMIKIHSTLQRFDILDGTALELFEEIAGMDIPVIFDTARIPLKYLRPEDKTEYQTTPDKLLTLHSLLPDLKMIAAHGGGVLIPDRERKTLIDSGIYIEISTSFNSCDWPENNYEQSIENLSYLLNNHDQDRLFFGTDSPWRNQKIEIEELVRLQRLGKITFDQMEKIFWMNANTFFDLGLE